MSKNIHPLSDIQSQNIGDGTRIWQFCVVLPNAKIGANCNICAQVLIENDVIIGDNVTVKSGVQLWDGLRIENDVFIGPNVNFTNDKFPQTSASIGGGYLTQYNHRQSRDGCGMCGRNAFYAGSSGCDRQSRQNYCLCGSEQ